MMVLLIIMQQNVHIKQDLNEINVVYIAKNYILKLKQK